jgi:RNA polymerase sigma-70 factor (ECF subfamily)
VFTDERRLHCAALVDGMASLVFAPGVTPRVVFEFVVEEGRVRQGSLIAEPRTIWALDLEL